MKFENLSKNYERDCYSIEELNRRYKYGHTKLENNAKLFRAAWRRNCKILSDNTMNVLKDEILNGPDY